MVKTITRSAALMLSVLLILGCDGSQPRRTRDMSEARARTEGARGGRAHEYLARTAQRGESVRDLVTATPGKALLIQADSVIIGLNGRGTARIDPKLRPALVKLLVKAYDSLELAQRVLKSKDAAPVRCVTEIPPFSAKGDKIDLKIISPDPSVNLEGGTLVDTPLMHYVRLGGKVDPAFSTRSGLVSAGIRAYARGDITLNPGYRRGRSLGRQIPNVGYIPAGAMLEKDWGGRLLLKKPDRNTSLLVQNAIQRRFGDEVNVGGNSSAVVFNLPKRYRDYENRFVSVLLGIKVRPGSRQASQAHIDRLVRALGSAGSKERYAAECVLEAYGSEAGPALLNVAGAGTAAQRESALRVLAFLGEERCGPFLAEASRRAGKTFRAESTYLMSLVGGPEIEQRLVEMLTDTDPRVGYGALMALDALGVRDVDDVRTWFSKQRNLALHLVAIPQEKAVVVKPLRGVRHIAVFGVGVAVKPGFSGSVGPVTVTVKQDVTEVRHKRSPDREPLTMQSVELKNVVILLDRIGVSVNDIIGLIALMDRKGALGADLCWMD